MKEANRDREPTEEAFLETLYDTLQQHKKHRLVPWNPDATVMPSRDQLHPRHPRFQPGWRWDVEGVRHSWWLTIVDPRYPGPEYPYRVRPQGDPAFFLSAQNAGLLDDLDTFINVLLLNAMEECDLGQTNAEKAYDQGATAEAPPWVSTTIE